MIFAIVGPSGAGKDTLIRGALAAQPDLRLVRRVITRPTEAGGEDFEGVTPEDFSHRKARGDYSPKHKTKEDGHKMQHAGRVAFSHEFVGVHV